MWSTPRHSPAALPRGRRPVTHCTGGFVNPKTGLGSRGEFLSYWDSILGPSNPSESPYRLHYSGSRLQKYWLLRRLCGGEIYFLTLRIYIFETTVFSTFQRLMCVNKVLIFFISFWIIVWFWGFFLQVIICKNYTVSEEIWIRVVLFNNIIWT